MKISQKNEKLPIAYKVLVNSAFLQNSQKDITDALTDLSDSVQKVCDALNDFEVQIKYNTRSTNRAYLFYMTNCLWDNLTIDFESIWVGEYEKLSETLGCEFDAVMNDTRSKPLYKCGERLRAAVNSYDNQHKAFKDIAAEILNAK
jgi:phage-related tail protein